MSDMKFQTRYEPSNIRNVAIIAHVDHGKTTLVDAMIRQSGLFRKNQQIEERFLDSNDIERERGITILSKNLSLDFMGNRINIVDTPGHVDFGGEVERVLQMANGCLLVVDAFEGPRPQTRFVLRKALAAGLRPIVVINKIDRPDARPSDVVDEVIDLFIDLGIDDYGLDFPILFASGRDGYACTSLDNPRTSIRPLFDAIMEHVPAPTGNPDGIGKLLVTSLDYNDYVGRIAIGRVFDGTIKAKSEIWILRENQPPQRRKISHLYGYQGIKRTEAEFISAGDIAAIAGIENIGIGDTISENDSDPLPVIEVDRPVISMLFAPNQSPLAGRSGRFLTARQIQARLSRELESNVALRMEPTEQPDMVKVSGRGELQMAILIETMRREGYELQVSKPKPILITDESGQLLEPIEEVTIDIPESYFGSVMEMLGPRRGICEATKKLPDGGIHIVFNVPARGLLGFRSALLTMTNGTGILNQDFRGYEPVRGEIPGRRYGVMVAMESGVSTEYAIRELVERGTLFYGPGEDIYEGLVVGERPISGDMYVNIVRKKHLTNVRSSTREELERVAPPRRLELDKALEYVSDDEWIEVTPDAIRIRKREFGYKRRG